MELNIYDLNFNRLGVLDTPSSVIWHRQYNTAGTFEIFAPATPYFLALLRRGYIVCCGGNVESGIIDTLQIKQNEDGETITAQGRMLSGILGQRVIDMPLDIDTTAEKAMRQLVEANAINPSDPARVLPGLVFGYLNGFDFPLKVYIKRQNLLECLSKISQVSTLGFRVHMDVFAKQFVFEVYRGLDRSASQSFNPRAVFSEDTDTLGGMEYSATDTGTVNAVIAKSADFTLTVGTGESAFSRYEKMVEVEPVVYTITDGEGNTYERISAGQTQAAMKKAADELLAEPQAESFEGNILTGTNSLIYRQDFDLGDMVSVKSKRWGISKDVRITAIDEVYDENGVRIIPTFGSPLPSLIDILKE